MNIPEQIAQVEADLRTYDKTLALPGVSDESRDAIEEMRREDLRTLRALHAEFKANQDYIAAPWA